MNSLRRILTAAALVAALLAPLRGAAQAPATETLTFAAAADTYVESTSPTKNFNAAAELKADADPIRITYLRFAIAGVNGRSVLQARLRLGCVGPSVSGGTVHRITNNSWDEATVTYNARPAVDGPAVYTLGAVALNQTAEWNLDGAITGDGVYSLAIDNASTDGVTYTSAAASSGQKPALVLTVAAGPEPTVSIVQPSDGARFFVGDTVTLQATATDAVDGNLSAAVAWTSSLQGALGTGATVSRQLVEGTHDITAAVTDRDGNRGIDRVSITVTPPPPGNTEPLVTISSPVPGQSYTAGVPVAFSGSASDLEDGNLSSALSWTSDRDGALGTGASFSRALSAGTHQITARARDTGGLIGETAITVSVAAPATLEFTPVADTYVDAGSPTTKFGASPLLRADADTARIAYLRFQVSGLGGQQVGHAVVRLQADTGSAAGSDVGGIIRRISNNTWAESTVTYSTRPALDGTILSVVGPVRPGQVVDFDVTSAITADGTYNFAITNSSTDGVDYRSREGGPSPRLIVTLLGNAPMVAVMAPANQSVFFTGTRITFTGKASDQEDGDLSSRLGWSSSLDGALGTGATISSASLRAGTHTITAAVTDADGHRGEGQVSIRVRGSNVAPTVGITAPTNGAVLAAGTVVTLAGSASDDFDTNLSGAIQWRSSRDGALGVGASINHILSEGSHTITATATDSDGATGTASIGLQITPTAPVVTISAPAANAMVFGGVPLAFSGSATDATDGNLSAGLSWTSDRDGAIGTGASFSTSALTVGTHLVTAAVRDRGGLLGKAERTVTVRPPNALPTLAIGAPLDGASLLSGKPVLLTATAQDAENGNLASAVRWSSSRDGALGTGGTFTVPSLTVGTHVLTATVTDLDGAVATASVTVTLYASSFTFLPTADTYVDSGKPTTKFGTSTTLWADSSPVRQMYFRFPVAGLGPFAVDKAILRLTVGSTSASASTRGGTVHAITNNAWTEADTTYGTRPAVDGPALASRTTAVKTNAVVDFDVTAGVAADGVYNFALITTSSDEVIYQSRESSKKPQLLITLKQNTAPVVAITAPAPGATALVGAPVTLSGTATDAESGNLSAQLRWTSSLMGALGTGATLTVTNLVPGAHVITATVTDPSGATASAQTSVTVDHLPAVAITAPANGAVVFTNQLPLTFRGTATDEEDGDLGARLAWSSSLDGALGTGASITRSTLSVGTHVIRAAVADAAGATGEATITIRVRTPNVAPRVTITAPVSGFSAPAGTSITLTATATDDFDGDVTARITWTDGATPLGTGGTLTRLLAEGPHTITAAVTDSDGVLGSAQVSGGISPTPPVVTITAPAAGALIFAGNPLTFTGTASDATQGDMSAALHWTSNLDGTIGDGASVTTSALRPGSHVVTAAVTDASHLTGQAQRTVVIQPPNALPVLTISSPEDGAAFLAGRQIVLSASASDAEDGNLGTSVRWSSSRDGAIGTGAVLNVAALSAGTHVLTAAVTDRAGASVEKRVTITVTPQVLVVTPAADTFVDSSVPTQNFGTSGLLEADGSPVTESFLRFVLDGIGPFPIQSVVLRLTVNSTSSAASVSGGIIHRISDDSWSEATTTWNTRPTIDGPILATRGAVAVNEVVDFDLTGTPIANGPIDLALVSENSDSVKYQSREATSGRPQLIVTFALPGAPQVSITTPAANATLSADAPADLEARATDPEQGDLSASIEWRSSVDGVLGTGARLQRQLSPGAHTLVATVVDRDGNTSSATVAVTVQSTNNPGGYDFAFGSGVEDGDSNEATAQKPEAKLWFVDGLWWGTLYNQAAHAHHIYKFNRSTSSWSDTGVLIDERAAARQDVLWDGSKLYMVSRYALSPAQCRLLRFSYNATTKTWTRDAGFPIDISGGATETMTIAKDTTGTLWIAYTLGSKVWVNRTLGSDTTWDQPYALPFAEGSVYSDDIAGVQAMNGKIGVFWSNQNLKKDFFAVHNDRDPLTTWTLETAGSGGKFADDHFNMKFAADGRLFVMVKTSYGLPGEILDGLLVRSPNGTWSPLIAISRVDFNPTRELILLDETHRKIYAFYSLNHQAIYYKVSDMDTIAFPEGAGIPFITDSVVTDLNNPVSTKQSVNATTGILVEASSRADSSYWHAYLPIAP